ncbi:DUF523 domain-containing protein [Pseudaeromonas paramecii]|uniref:DUF523 domain-containing protein n=1 Tax=Pseudaeromonas paramecii TaxID=2138166 RepID=A0ABP8QJF4_9GAMM
MKKILVSACLLGQPVRYDGQGKGLTDPRLARWQAQGRLVSVCPELAGGLPVPRAPAERQEARVVTVQGEDVTAAFACGAQAALQLCQAQGIRLALLKEGSPSCGSQQIYDGTFAGQRVAGEGVTAALLRAHGIQVYAETQLAELALALGES